MPDLRLKELDMPWTGGIPGRTVPPAAETDAEVERRMAELAPVRDKLFAYIDEHRDEIVKYLQDLVRIESVNPSPEFEKNAAAFTAETMRSLGMEVRQLEPEPNRISNWGLYKGTKGDRTLLFDAHLDTVPAGDEANWNYPPFGAEIDDGKLYGRGAKDCKLGIASSLMALKMLQGAGVELEGNVMITLTADEETGGHLGIAKMIEAGWVKADYAIYGEGMPDRLTIGHRGLCQVEITTTGTPAHTAWKQNGLNAIVKMAKVIEAVEHMEFTPHEPHPVVPGGPVASVNIINGGFKENVVADSCTILVDMRFPPSVTVQTMLADLERALDKVRAADPDLNVVVKPKTIARPSFSSPEEPIVRYLSASVEHVLGQKPVAEGMMATSDARWILLDAHVPIVNYSLGNGSGHMPNEYIVVDQYIQNVKIYALAALLLLA